MSEGKLGTATNSQKLTSLQRGLCPDGTLDFQPPQLGEYISVPAATGGQYTTGHHGHSGWGPTNEEFGKMGHSAVMQGGIQRLCHMTAGSWEGWVGN